MVDEAEIERDLSTIMTLAATPDRYLGALALLERMIYDRGAACIDLIEARAESDAAFKEVVAGAFVGGVGGEAVERFHALQERLFVELGLDSPY
jgi:hypothetical protein